MKDGGLSGRQIWSCALGGEHQPQGLESQECGRIRECRRLSGVRPRRPIL